MADITAPPDGTVAIRIPKGFARPAGPLKPSTLIGAKFGPASMAAADVSRWVKKEFNDLLPAWKGHFHCTGHAATGTVIVRPINDYPSPLHWTLPNGEVHPFEGEEKFLWTDRGDGVLYGVANPETAHKDDIHLPPDVTPDAYGFTIQTKTQDHPQDHPQEIEKPS